jgi:hypothetical protein
MAMLVTLKTADCKPEVKSAFIVGSGSSSARKGEEQSKHE